MREVGLGFFLGLGRGDDGDGETEDVFDIFVGSFGEYGMFAQTERVVAHLVYGSG